MNEAKQIIESEGFAALDPSVQITIVICVAFGIISIFLALLTDF